MPAENDFLPRDAVDVLLDEFFKELIRHSPRPGPPGKGFFAKVKTIFAIQIAGGPRRFGHDMKPPLPQGPEDSWHLIFVERGRVHRGLRGLTRVRRLILNVD